MAAKYKRDINSLAELECLLNDGQVPRLPCTHTHGTVQMKILVGWTRISDTILIYSLALFAIGLTPIYY